MSGGTRCRCPESKKPLKERAWICTQYKSNRSAFSGYRYTPSNWSAIVCRGCHRMWRTKADYAGEIKQGSLLDRE